MSDIVFKGTQGEWEVDEHYQLCGPDNLIADLDFNMHDEYKANALLISKSLKMYEMLCHIYANDLLRDHESEVYNLLKEVTNF